MLFQKADHALTLLLKVLGSLPGIELLCVGQQFCELGPDDSGVRCVIARKHEAWDRAAPHEVSRDAEDKAPTPHIAPEFLYRGVAQLRPRRALLLGPRGMALREVVRKFGMEPNWILQDCRAYALWRHLAQLQAVAGADASTKG